MKRLSMAVMTALMLSFSLTWAGPFEDGIARGVVYDFVEAVKWFRLAAAQGDATAQYNLGLMYSEGRGVVQDFVEAVKWFRLAAAQGYMNAQLNLGVMYQNGRGIAQDYAEAVKWYRPAALQGNADAQFNLGLMYGTGKGVVQDPVRAHVWLNLAAVSGGANAVKLRDELAKLMMPEEIAQAHQMARDCQQRNFKGCD